jgi:hypothetical protein
LPSTSFPSVADVRPILLIAKLTAQYIHL